ncbi:MAG: hypothetical protein JWM64_400, partial [Frankiales bacterium]|nr:hypothetical protein [Frankiales bacterium]
MGTLTDDDLRQLLGEAAASYAVPDGGPEAVLAAHEERPVVVGLPRRRVLQLSSAAGVVALAVLAGVTLQGRGDGGPSSLAAAPAASGGGTSTESLASDLSGQPTSGDAATSGGMDLAAPVPAAAAPMSRALSDVARA